MTSEYLNESHLERNLALLVTGIIIIVVLGVIYVAPDMAEQNLLKKEWRENATCEELSDYLVVNVDDTEYRSYQKIEKIWEIKCP